MPDQISCVIKSNHELLELARPPAFAGKQGKTKKPRGGSCLPCGQYNVHPLAYYAVKYARPPGLCQILIIFFTAPQSPREERLKGQKESPESSRHFVRFGWLSANSASETRINGRNPARFPFRKRRTRPRIAGNPAAPQSMIDIA